jgi:hypothetical protein
MSMALWAAVASEEGPFPDGDGWPGSDGSLSSRLLDAAPWIMVVLLAFGVALVITFAVVGYRREKVRVSAVQAWALGGGWTMVDRDDRWVGAFFGTPFGQGSNRHADDVCTRLVDGWQQVAFTYRFETTSTSTTTDADGTTSTTTHTDEHAFTVVARQLPAVLGPLEIVPETVGQRIVRALGGQDVEVELADFNRRYRVTADDPKHALDLLNPRTVERLLAHGDASLRLRDGWAVSVAAGALQPDTAQERLSVLDDLLQEVPAFVWKDRGWSGEPSGATLRP